MNSPLKLPHNATDEERIVHFIQDESGQVELPPKLDQLYRMIDFCDDQLRRLNSRRTVAVMLRKKFSIGETKAYQIIAKSQAIFGSTNRMNKDYYRELIADAITEDLRIAREKGDSKAQVGLYDKLIKVRGLDRDDDTGVPAPPPPAVIIFEFDPSKLGVPVGDNLEKKAMEFLAHKTVDVESEDVTDNHGE